MNRFEGKTVLVTGGTSGIGFAAARAFAAEGARVVVTGRDPGALDAVRAQFGAHALALRNDTGTVAAARELAAEIGAAGLRLDAVFINAGVAKLAPFEAVDEALWDLSFNTNVKGAYFQIQALLPLLNRGASIVINGSINAHIGMPASSVYAASKAALISLAKTLSAELLPRGVRVNVISPGPVETPLYGKLGLDAATLDATAAQIRSQVPLGRFGTPDEIASTVLHLSAAESAFIVGSEVIVDGGMSQL
ncbi:SDR family oxidoreductase [Paraburkholderia caballeronis]|uniref:SDR family oxidoreductase n=1 Tax=Paraburkholderia caballeronis TaxID=416943 RepID=UPI001064CBD8|nr:SDR family oxidoreductase [Paraburkholderia caballeronis]TDV11619.1 NAD(P)-dependent dehydrogenase (short-subunit alcohol dehydrogenase family) [Paraburkholderia caballeronis]TDV17374.1 NAD(P)-dependent dehydrogenase (short-subunit alcohol dehydrogenase family) [Paraburkholderia caballeronis]TDV27392.1 NAD(P)-dependent dehydrogenase (short-subunit alcohol dehydrogenase family) [Paraburkholderia caballeronis]